MLPRVTAAGEGAFVPHAGGSVYNTAMALGRLGAPVAFFSGISTDMMGERLMAPLAASGVDTTHLVRNARPTTLAFVELHDGHARYAFYDEGTAGRMLGASDLPAPDVAPDALFFGGISLVNEPAAATYEALQAREASGRVIMIDPNIRPDFIAAAGNEGTHRARLRRMIARANIVKISDEDLLWLMAAEADGADAGVLARALLDLGPALVLLTEGARGARAFTQRTERHCAAPRVTVADTVGAGDTFNAGVLAALWQAGALSKPAVAALADEVIDRCLDLGTRAAAVTVSRPGADPPWAHELTGAP